MSGVQCNLNLMVQHPCGVLTQVCCGPHHRHAVVNPNNTLCSFTPPGLDTICPSLPRHGRFSAATPSISRNGPRVDQPEPGESQPALSIAPTSAANWTSQPAYPTPGLGFKGNEEEAEDKEGREKKEDTNHVSIETYPVKSNH